MAQSVPDLWKSDNKSQGILDVKKDIKLIFDSISDSIVDIAEKLAKNTELIPSPFVRYLLSLVPQAEYFTTDFTI